MRPASQDWFRLADHSPAIHIGGSQETKIVWVLSRKCTCNGGGFRCDSVRSQPFIISGTGRYSTISFLRLWTNATTSPCSASGTWNFARVAAA